MANEAKQFTINGVTHDVMDVGARQLIADLQTAINAITSGDTTTAIKTFQEVVNFLDGVTDDATLIGKLNELRTLIAAKYTKPSTGIPASDLADGVIPETSGFATKDEVALKANSADVYTKAQTDALVVNAGKVKSVSVNSGEPAQPDAQGNVNIEVQGADGKSAYQSYLDTTSDNPKKTEAQWVASLKGTDGATGATGPQGNSGVASADGIESVNNLNGAPADTGSKVYVLGANMGKELNNTFSPLKPLIGEAIENVTYEKGRYTNYNVNIGSTYTGNAEGGGTDEMRAKLTVKAGDTITVYGKTSVWGGLYAFCDTDDILVAKTAASQNVAEGDALVFTVPTDGTMYLNASNTVDYGCTWQHKAIVKADVSNDGIMSKEQAAALTVATEETVRDKNLNKMKFGTIGTSTGTFAKYVDIPRSCFGNRGFLWFTDGDYTTYASWTGYVKDGVFTRHDFFVDNSLYRLYSGDDQYYIKEFSLEGIGDCDFIRLSLYQYDDAKIAAMFVGSDLDADYLSWDFVKLRKLPPVSSEWYRGESEEIAAIVTKNPSGVPGVYVSKKNLVNPYAFRFAEVSTGSPYYPVIATDYIPVVSGTTYTKTIENRNVNNFRVWFYDSNKNRLDGSSTLYDRFVAPSDAAYARIFLSSYNNLTVLEQNVRIQLEQGERTEFEDYFLFPNELKKSHLSGKTFATIGDSFTAPATWVSVMCDILGASSYKNVAKSGGRWSYYADPKCAYLQAQELVTYYSTVQTGQTTPPAKPDYILCVLGVNDSNNNIPIGDIVYSDTIGEPGTTVSGEINPSTFTGGIQALLKTLKDNFPTSIIKIGYTPGGMQYHQPNQLELVEQYIDRLKLVANLYGVGYIETRACGMCRINQVEYEAYRKSQTDPHPNSAGQQRIGEYMARIMLSNL